MEADPELADLVAERHGNWSKSDHDQSPVGPAQSTHLAALRAASFAEIGTLWQRGDNRLLCAVLPG